MFKNFFKVISFVMFGFLAAVCVMACDLPDSSIVYYNSITNVERDIEKEQVGKHAIKDAANACAMVEKDGEKYKITLLKNIKSDEPLAFKNTIIDLNGYELSFKSDEGLILSQKSEVIGTVPGSKLSINNDSGATLISINRTGNVIIDGGEYIVNSKNNNVIGIHVFGKAEVNNAKIIIDSLPTQNPGITCGIRANLFSKVYVDNCNIKVTTTDGEAYGVFSGDYAEISNTDIVALANYMSNESGFTILSIGCYSEEYLKLTNCNITGIHSGVNASGNTEINGSTYAGYGHGGLYFCGANSTSYAKNATFVEIPMPDGYQTYGPQSTHAGFYIGGGYKQDNIVVYMDNCNVESTGNAFVLRGTSGELNNTLYISNSSIQNQAIRIDNNTHKLVIGTGCNFTKDVTTLPEVVKTTNEQYTKP